MRNYTRTMVVTKTHISLVDNKLTKTLKETFCLSLYKETQVNIK